MAFRHPPFAALAATGRFLPEQIVRNADFAAMGLDTSHERILELSGIGERRRSGDGDSVAAMASRAAAIALQRASVDPRELDAVILSTATPDRLLPATAAEVQALLGADQAFAFDLSAACSGWLYGLAVAEGLLASGAARKVLVAGAERMSAIIDPTDRATAVLFGDGAAAAVVSRAQDARGILASVRGSDGRFADLLCRPGGGARMPLSQEVLDTRSHYVRMVGREIFKHAVRAMSEAAAQALHQAGLTVDDIDLLIPHQANVRIIEATARQAGFPMERVYVNVDRVGNTSSASIPIALDEAIESGRVGAGALVLLVAFGAGLTWGAAVVRL